MRFRRVRRVAHAAGRRVGSRDGRPGGNAGRVRRPCRRTADLFRRAPRPGLVAVARVRTAVHEPQLRQLLLSSIQARIRPDDIPTHAMTQVMAGMITHAGIALAEASPRNRKRIRQYLYTAIYRVMTGLRTPYVERRAGGRGNHYSPAAGPSGGLPPVGRVGESGGHSITSKCARPR